MSEKAQGFTRKERVISMKKGHHGNLVVSEDHLRGIQAKNMRNERLTFPQMEILDCLISHVCCGRPNEWVKS